MEKTREGLCSLINKVDICLKGNVISNEEVLKIEEQFLTEAYKDCREHKTLFIQHGINELNNNVKAWDSFQLANRAMFMQRVQIVLQR